MDESDNFLAGFATAILLVITLITCATDWDSESVKDQNTQIIIVESCQHSLIQNLADIKSIQCD
ncbi:MAG: hypothetical protein AAFQ94_09255 [Bacteroidota bacterium]